MTAAAITCVLVFCATLGVAAAVNHAGRWVNRQDAVRRAARARAIQWALDQGRWTDADADDYASVRAWAEAVEILEAERAAMPYDHALSTTKLGTAA